MARNDGFGAERRIGCSCKGVVTLRICDIRYIFRERDLVDPPCCTKNDVSRHFSAAFLREAFSSAPRTYGRRVRTVAPPLPTATTACD